MHNSKIKRISLAVCLALMPFAVDAAGLGRMTVMSGLGEPLNAEIEISASKEELSSLSARIAPAETYAEQGVERTSSLGGVRVELGKKADGSPILKLSTYQPVDDPFLDMLIQVDWPTGRLLREYTALLDPPGYGGRATASSAVSVEGAQLSTVQPPSKKNTSKRPSWLAQTARPGAAQPETSGAAEGYLTKRGDTLRNVARQMQVDDVTLEQMLVGLYRANRDAFIGDNMNQLKAGQIMRAPRDEELRAVSPREALQEVRVHTANWNSYRNTLADTVAKSAPAQGESRQQTSSGKITAAAEDKAAPPATGPRDVVKLSRSETEAAKAGAAADKSGVTEDKLRALEEESTAQEKSIAEVNERIAFFEKQIQDMQKLLLVQNQMLADLQKGKTPQPPAAEVPPAAAVEPQQPQEQQPAAPAPVTEAKPAAPAAPKAPAEPAPEPGLLDTLTEDPVMLGGAGGLLVLLGGAWLYLRGKRRKSLDNFEKGILTSGGLKSDTVFGATAGGAVDTGETSFLSNFSQRSGAGMIDTSDVDPISEAEVYMAYGRDAQAEEILKDAIGKEPKRYELQRKLLEIYANRKDAVAFETLAGELYATCGAADPNWMKVAELGRMLEPENPMYAATAETVSVTETVPAAPTETGSGAESSLDMPLNPADSEAEESATRDNSLDFDLGMLAADEPAAVPELEKEGEEAAAESLPDLGSFDAPAPGPEAIDEKPAEEESAMDFQFELPEPASEENVQLDAADLGMPEVEPEIESAAAEPSTELPDLNVGETAMETASDLPASMASEQVEDNETELTLPELPGTEVPGETVEEISFDLPELAMPEAESSIEEEVFELPEIGAELPSFDEESPAAGEVELPEAPTEFPAGEEPGEPTVAELEEPVALELPEIGKQGVEDVMEAEAPAAAAEVEEIELDETPAGDSKLDFNFNVDIEAEAPAEEAAPGSASALPDLDLSGISLDIGDAGTAEAQETEEITLSGSESADVDTKLDLVTAYMDMGDTEGARELLEEVLQEGGPQQRERARNLLDSLG